MRGENGKEKSATALKTVDNATERERERKKEREGRERERSEMRKRTGCMGG